MSKQPVTVKATFERWVDDRLEELEKSRQDLADGLQTSSIWVTRLINNPETAKVGQMMVFAEVLEIKDWFQELFCEWGMATETALALDLNRELAAEGCKLDRVQHAA